MIIRYSNSRKVYYLLPSEMRHADVATVRKAGFDWFDTGKLWVTVDPFRACALFYDSENTIDEHAFTQLAPTLARIRLSKAETTALKILKRRNTAYLDYQEAGIESLSARYSAGHKTALLADPMGLGKSIMACGLVNHGLIDPSKVLVVCPASLRINWQRELDKWLVWKGKRAFPILDSKPTQTAINGTPIISYELLLNDFFFNTFTYAPNKWELVIFDESHYLKNPEAKRTKACLAVADNSKNVLLMSGTPIPNRPHEFYSTLHTLAPDVSGGMTEMQFCNRYTTGEQDQYGWRPTGGKNHEELSARLRGTGFMVRRDKRKVLPQLPPERHSMIIFPQTAGTAKVVQKEHDNIKFSATEILAAGKPLGYGAIPELRREMGVEKVPQSVEWIKDQLDSEVDKMVVFAYHREVLLSLHFLLAEYNPLMIYGITPQSTRQAFVDMFQTNPKYRIIMGSWSPLGVGWTLTASDTCVMVESAFTPGVNDQCSDRLVRIGQEAGCVNVYKLVVEGSVEATVLAKAASKQYDIGKVLA